MESKLRTYDRIFIGKYLLGSFGIGTASIAINMKTIFFRGENDKDSHLVTFLPGTRLVQLANNATINSYEGVKC